MTKLIDMANQLKELAVASIPDSVKETALLRAFTAARIPLIAFLSPVVNRIDDDGVEITIPLTYRSKNHLRSMYFGALATGADLALGYMAFRAFQKQGERVQLAFKSFHAEFLKRAEGDVKFTFSDGEGLLEMVSECLQSDERVNREFEVIATCPKISPTEPVARFKLELSLKHNKKKN